jgi:hypothetical protein
LEKVESFFSSDMAVGARTGGSGGPVFIKKSARAPVSVARVERGNGAAVLFAGLGP